MRCFVLLLAVSACAPTSPPADAPPVEAPLPVVRVTAGRSDTLALAALPDGAEFGRQPGAQVERLGDGRVVVETPADASGLVQVPFRAGAASGVLVVHAVGREPGGSLGLALVGTEAEAPDILAFRVVRRDGAGRVVPPELDDEESTVALVGDVLYTDTAIDAFDDYVRLDLDAVPPGRHRLRVAVQVEGQVSNWVALDLDGRQPVRR